MSAVSIEPGKFVRLRTDPTRAGIALAGEKVQAGHRMVPVQFSDGRVSWLPATALEKIPEALPELSERFAAGQFAGPDWLRRTLARLRVTGRLSNVVYSMQATETDFYPYQFKPVLKLLNSPTDGLLIADEVGLGKTIEAGLIWTELRARLQTNRLLVLCPKTLCDKWRLELRRRFGVDARIVDAMELVQLLSDPQNNRRGFAAIASMQGLRPPRGWDSTDNPDNSSAESPRSRLARLLYEAAEGQPLLDLLVTDEAHHMRNPDTLLHQLAQLLNAVASHRVFLSATPIHLRNRDLHSLLRLIDPDTFEFEHTLDELIRTNAPIVAARDLILKPTASAADVVECIEMAQQYRFLESSKTLALVREEVMTRPLDQFTRAELAARLEQSNQLANYVTRTRRRDVQELRVHREAWAPQLEMHDDERHFYEAVTEAIREYASERAANERFLLSTAQRMLSSSPAAASEYWSANGYDESNLPEESDQDLVENGGDDRPLVARLAELSRRMALSKRLAEVDTKYALLVSQIRELWKREPEAKIIIFSSFKPTLFYLRRRLNKEGVLCELLHGSVNEPREVILNRFRDSASAKVLLSSEVGAEGVDLQFSWIVVNYDLPWNPMRLEQRIGRVDRIGQAKSKVVILNLIHDGTIDNLIYERLYRRLGLAEMALGRFEAVLGEPLREMTLKLLDPNLTDQQKATAIDHAAQVVAIRTQHEEQLEAEAGSLVQHGDYILQKIIETRELNRWLRGTDILVYVADRLARSYPGCSIETSPPASQTYRISLSPDARGAFAEFVAKHGLHGSTRLIDADEQQRYRFTESVVRSTEARIENISQMHPLVRFAAHLDLKDPSGMQSHPVAVTIPLGAIGMDCAPGVYALAVRSWRAGGLDGRVTNAVRLAFAGARVGERSLLSAETVESLVTAAAERGQSLQNAGADDRLLDAARLLQNVVIPELERRFEEYVNQIRAEIDDRATIRHRAIERHRETKSESLTRLLERFKSQAEYATQTGNERRAQQMSALVSATSKKLRELQDNCERRLKEIDSQRSFTPEESDVSAVFLEVVE